MLDPCIEYQGVLIKLAENLHFSVGDSLDEQVLPQKITKVVSVVIDEWDENEGSIGPSSIGQIKVFCSLLSSLEQSDAAICLCAGS
eukprot:CAMPEP_0113662038 /NCGR_PEP_ID=MMETSP0038_2-20120614/335_1 /TAXON_ID=2898 /ORGANISM="Cryptomonas paramecium" /LENGTH=85 /DNA_ID=CAMNT_0000576851 /DNA_START=42 /DNA_END=296 /DNA_ORIENTATION=- /assembly_acc=CAM_ASM_000170